MSTYMAKTDVDGIPINFAQEWYVIDATDKVVGRLAATVATILRGKHKPQFTPHQDTGDYVIIINAEKVKFTGRKLEQKVYQSYSHYPGGQATDHLVRRIDQMPLLGHRPCLGHVR